MIETKLEYNPYLNKTVISFNGKEPKINSLVEKYVGSKLQTWIKDLPEIFHDEMNGYDFDLLFTGTELEFEELKKAFKNVGVTDEEVNLVHINKLESREEKIKRINNLLKWLKVNRNDRFDYERFLNVNSETIEQKPHCIIVHAHSLNINALGNDYVKVEYIMDIAELKNTDLRNIPIIFFVDHNVLNNLKNEVKFLLSKDGVFEQQIFFCNSLDVNENVVSKKLIDSGINKPQYILKINDCLIINYLNSYPISNYIFEMNQLFKKEYLIIDEKLKYDSEKSITTNKDVHANIDKIDIAISNLKLSLNTFNNKDELYLNNQYIFLKDDFIKKISKWRSFYTKIYNEYDAKDNSVKFFEKLQNYADEFKNQLRTLEEKIQKKIWQERKNWFSLGMCNFEYSPDVHMNNRAGGFRIKDNLSELLMDIKREEIVVENKFMQLFADENDGAKEQLQTIWFVDDWKKFVLDNVLPIMDKCISESINRLNVYAEELENDYKNKLKDAIKQEETEKYKLILQLSETEKQLEQDNSWLNDFKEQLLKIETE